jgi:hypothetical protein
MKALSVLLLVLTAAGQANAAFFCKDADNLEPKIRIVINTNVFAKQSGDQEVTEHEVVTGVNISHYQYYVSTTKHFVSATETRMLMMELFEEPFNRGIQDYIEGQVRFKQNQLPRKINCTPSPKIKVLNQTINDFFSEI